MMLKTLRLLLIVAVVFPQYGKAQLWREDMMKDGANFYDIQKKYNEKFRKEEKQMRKNVRKALSEEEEGGFQIYKRWENFIEPRIAPLGVLPNPMVAFDEMNKFRKNNPASNYKTSGNWTPLGPFVRNSLNTIHGMGRVNSVAVNPNDANNIYVATASGGIWSTNNGGTTWLNNTDELPVLGFSNLVINPQNTNIIYAASGDGEAGDTYGLGVLKSIDGGQSWNTTGLNFLNNTSRIIKKVIMNENNPDELLAISNTGLFKTSDGGDTWLQIRKGNYSDIEYKPGDPSVVYMVSTLFLKSTDGGQNFSVISNGLPGSNSVNRLSIAVTPANPAYVYLIAGAASNSGLEGIYRSTDSGDSFSLRADSPNIMGWKYDGSDAGGQSWYTLSICASPTDAELIFAGGVNVWASTDGGNTLSCVAHWTGANGLPFVHADIHDLSYQGNILCVSSDGGLFTSGNDGATFTDRSSGLVISQFYRLSCSQINTDLILAGAQDNSSSKRLNNTWKQIRGGDGMEQLIHVNNTNILFSSSQYGSIGRSTNGGTNFTNILGSLNGTGDWVTPFVMSPGGTFYVAYKDVYRSSTNGSTYTKISNFAGSNFTLLHVSPSDSNYILVGRAGSLNITKNGGTTWQNIGANIANNGMSNTYACFHPTNPQRFWVTCSGYSSGRKIFETNDGGLTFTNISLNLPNLPVNCVAYQTGSNDGLYVGTDMGVFYKNNTMKNWQPFMNGLPNVIVDELEIVYPINKIRAATYGRGIWESSLYAVSSPEVDFLSTNKKICEGQTVTYFDISTEGPTSRLWTFNGGTPSSSTSDTVTVTYPAVGNYDVTLQATNGAGSNTLTKPLYVDVSNTVAGVPFSEGFEGTGLLPGGWDLINHDLDFTWIQTSAAGGFGTSSKSLLYKNFNNFNSGVKDDIITLNFDMSQLTTAEISFDVAHARNIPTQHDSLALYVSDDCGATYTKIYNKGSALLKTVGGYITYNFVPAANEWRKEVININQYAGKPKVMFKFVASSGGGNNLYLDNINIGPMTGLGLQAANETSGIIIQPNPVEDVFNISLGNITSPGNTTVTIYDVTGKVITKALITDNTIEIDCSAWPAGIYIAKFFTDNDYQYSQKINKL